MRVVLVFLLLLSSGYSFSQVELEGATEANTNSQTFLIKLNTNGFGFSYGFFKRKDALKSYCYEIDFDWVKHPKEHRTRSQYDESNRFVFGKLNQLMTLKAGWGLKKRKFTKQVLNGVAIDFYSTAGVSLAFLKPMYYYENGKDPAVPFSEDVFYSPLDIYKSASFFKGFDRIDLVLGGYVKLGVVFDISSKKGNVSNIEMGAVAELFSKTIPLMSGVKAQPYLLSLFIGYRFGKKTKKVEYMQ